MRGLAASVATAVLLVASACGGGGGEATGTVPASAEFAPATAPVFIALNTDVDSEQWKTADRLSKKFPGREDALAKLRDELAEENLDFERDVRPALGDELGIVWLDLAGGGDNAVAFTRPNDRAKLKRLLESGDDPPVYRQIDGWTVIADEETKLDRFETARGERSLADEGRFQDAMEGLPEDALARFYVEGQALQDAFEQGIAEEGGPPNLTEQAGRLDSLAGAVSTEDDGVSFETAFVTDPPLEVDSYEAMLPQDLPAGALLFYSFGRLERTLRDTLEAVGDSIPGFEEQLAEGERALGFSLEDDLFPLFAGEGAVAVYPESPTPRVTFALAVDDEDKARKVLERLGALAELGDTGTTRTFTFDGVRGTELTLTEPGFSVFHAVFDGKLVVASSQDALETVREGGTKLADDDAYTQATEAAGLPGETVSHFYVDLDEGLTFLFDLAEREGRTVPPEARTNTEPLRSLVVYGEQDGNRTRFTGFLAIE